MNTLETQTHSAGRLSARRSAARLSSAQRLSARRSAAAIALAAAAVTGAAVFLGAPAPAEAATSCHSVSYDQSTGRAVAACSGSGSMRFVVTCNAVWPYSPWTHRSGWIYINGGGNPVAMFSSCPWPASYSVRAEY
ncbi:hypothetical protein OSC27_10305 [Microbacterium sp. STN6]|uniref:hypothetical protein n=1 Tax=Microbacterium sp. STN6 TaxID=2995588 RepID=UPI002260B310|nr:hypothetical protein [Microbacterium sp. STN6]MCX7522667.1 hypothetical protein [Microbacterium sp. STN6]